MTRNPVAVSVSVPCRVTSHGVPPGAPACCTEKASMHVVTRIQQSGSPPWSAGSQFVEPVRVKFSRRVRCAYRMLTLGTTVTVVVPEAVSPVGNVTWARTVAVPSPWPAVSPTVAVPSMPMGREVADSVGPCDEMPLTENVTVPSSRCPVPVASAAPSSVARTVVLAPGITWAGSACTTSSTARGATVTSSPGRARSTSTTGDTRVPERSHTRTGPPVAGTGTVITAVGVPGVHTERVSCPVP